MAFATATGAGPVYIFLDESGDFNFSPSGSPYYLFGAVSTRDPVALDRAIAQLHYELLAEREHEHCFHATEDQQAVRDRVFAAIRAAGNFDFDALIIEKAKANPVFYDEIRFYPQFAGYLLRYILGRPSVSSAPAIVVVTDTLPMKKRREAVNKAVRASLRAARRDRPFTLVHHAAASHGGLQIADYCTWAVHKKWTHHELRPYREITGFRRSEFDIFEHGEERFF